MTIAVTLNHVHSNASSRRGSYDSNHSSNGAASSMISTNVKVRPHRKVQEYRVSSSSGDDSHNNMYHDHFLCQPQMLSNGYTVLPMLTLQDALLNYKAQRPQLHSHTTGFQHHSEHDFMSNYSTYSSSYPLFDQHHHGTMMFPSLTPSITTVIPPSSSSSTSQRLETGVQGYVTCDESSSMSSGNSRSVRSSNMNGEEECYQLHLLLQQRQHREQESQVNTIQKPSRVKLVRFAPTATMHTLPLESEHDMFHRWYQTDDYNNFESDNRQVVLYINNSLKEYCLTKDLSKVSMKMKNKKLLKIMQNDPTNLLPYQILGLEQFIYGPKYMYERRQETVHHNAMVLEMYDVQRTTKHYNPTVLRRVSERFSTQKVERAIRRATATNCTTSSTPPPTPQPPTCSLAESTAMKAAAITA